MRTLLSALAVACLPGCVTDANIACAISAINTQFRDEYESILAEKGSRNYPGLNHKDAIAAVHATLARLGMRVENRDAELGYLNVYAPAPRPLDHDEWQRAAQADLPHMREIAAQCVGWASQLIKFEPEGLDIVIIATAVETGQDTKISLTMRMREVAPPRSGMPRRDYAPPTAVRLGLDKIFGALETELRAAKKIP